MKFERNYYLEKLINSIDNKMIKIITGLRRSGKSFLLFNLFYDYLIKVLRIKPSHIITIQLDRKNMQKYTNPDLLCKYITEQIKDKDKYFVFIDEIQLCNGFVPVLNEFLHYDNVDVYVTGSNSRMLSTDVATEFRGRGWEIRLYPLSFYEFYLAGKYNNFDKALSDYWTFGGMPYCLYLKDNNQKMQYLKALFNETYIKDIKERNKIRSNQLINQIIDVVASNIGCYTNCLKLAQTIKSTSNITVSQNTIKNYLQFLEDAFVITKALKFDIKGKKYLSCPFKYYFTDVGLRNARLNFRQIEPPHLMENIVFNELLTRGYSIDTGVVSINEPNKLGSYQRKQLECDFVVNKADQRVYIQCVYSLYDLEKIKQESKSLNNIKDSFKKIIIVKDQINKTVDNNGIVIISLKDFLLGEKITDLDKNNSYDWQSISKLVRNYKR